MSGRRAARVDSNQREIVAGLRQYGCTVQPLASVGEGCPDLLVGYNGRQVLLEIKAGKGVLTPDERKWHAVWRGQVATVRTLDEAIAVVLRETER